MNERMKIIYDGPMLDRPIAICIDKSDPRFYGWLFAKHPDGQWVTIASPETLKVEAKEEVNENIRSFIRNRTTLRYR